MQNRLAISLLIKTEIRDYLKGRSPHFTPKETTMTKILRISLLLSALASTPALAAPDAPVERRVVVSTADLNLASARGQSTLTRRLAHAVVEACGTASDADLAGQNQVRRCRDEASSRVAAGRDQLARTASRGKDIVFASR
jgi:UrcA family protein